MELQESKTLLSVLTAPLPIIEFGNPQRMRTPLKERSSNFEHTELKKYADVDIQLGIY